MNFINLFKKIGEFFGMYVPDVTNDALEAIESSDERKSRFKDLVTAEVEIKEEVAEIAADVAEAIAANDEDSLWAIINEILLSGKKVLAIKTYREMTGVDLKEAKAAIDQYIIDTAEDDEEVA